MNGALFLKLYMQLVSLIHNKKYYWTWRDVAVLNQLTDMLRKDNMSGICVCYFVGLNKSCMCKRYAPQRIKTMWCGIMG